jgi:polyhydroxyalkanoate synthesis regulator phasin
MVVDAVQSYLNLANAMSRAARAQAVAVARTVLAQAGLEEAAADANERAGRLAEEAREARQANRDLVENLVAAELTKAASRFGFVRDEDLDEIREEIAELRAQLKKAQAAAAPAAATRPRARTASPVAAKDPTATAAPAKKAAARRTAAKKTEAAGSETTVGPPAGADA